MYYLTIAKVSEMILTRLRAYLVPEVIDVPGRIVLCHPKEKKDAAVTIYLFHIQENGMVRSGQMVSEGASSQRYPSSYYDLYYGITAWAESDEAYRSVEEQQICGRILQVLSDRPLVSPEGAAPVASGGAPVIQLLTYEQADQLRLWNQMDVKHRLTLFYRVSPVEIKSDKSKDIVRVSSIGTGVENREDEDA